jgi:hypothetical protein
MTQSVVPEVPQDVWCLRLSLDPGALDAPAILWTVLAEDPKPRFLANVQGPEMDAADARARRGRLRAAWDRLFSLVRGDRVYLLTPAPREHALTTNEETGHRWVVTKAVRTADGVCSWCVPFAPVLGQSVEITLDARNRPSLDDLVAGSGVS